MLARAGLSVIIYEAGDTVGGGMRSAKLTDPDFVHDVCSAIHPLAASSPFFKSLPLEEFGLQWINPPVALAHPLEEEPPVLLSLSMDRTLSSLGGDAKIYHKIMQPLIRKWSRTLPDILGPLKYPEHPVCLLGFALYGLQSAAGFTFRNFRGKRAKALFAGLAAHSMLPLETRFTAAVGLLLSLTGHTAGWPFPRGGSQKLADALTAYFKSLGGHIVTARPVTSLEELPPSDAVLFDTSPRGMLEIAGNHFPSSYRSRLRNFRYGPGVFKIDWALKNPIPFESADCREAGTLHIGGTMEEISEAEEVVWRGELPEKPFIILAQQSRFDDTRAPAGKHTAWAYCHVSSGSDFDMTGRIETQIERFAPGFSKLVIRRHVMTSVDMERYNANYVGGDINGGVQDWRQLYTRPVARLNPYTTPDPQIFICSSSTPPGGGVHGMCGYHAARVVKRKVFGMKN